MEVLFTLECEVEAHSSWSTGHLAGMRGWWGVWCHVWGSFFRVHLSMLVARLVWAGQENWNPFCCPGWFLKICLGTSASGFELWWANVRKDSLVSMWDTKDGCIKVMGLSWACEALHRCRSLHWEDYRAGTHNGQRTKRSHGGACPSHPSCKVASFRSYAMQPVAWRKQTHRGSTRGGIHVSWSCPNSSSAGRREPLTAGVPGWQWLSKFLVTPPL